MWIMAFHPTTALKCSHEVLLFTVEERLKVKWPPVARRPRGADILTRTILL